MGINFQGIHKRNPW